MPNQTEQPVTKVILITDGDDAALRVIEFLADELHLRCISASAGNPTPLTGDELVHLIMQAPYDPVLVMFDDKGCEDTGSGEMALRYVAMHPAIQVLGAIAVASNALDLEGASVDYCLTRDGKKIHKSVNKEGKAVPCGITMQGRPILRGDTVDILNELDIPLIIGIGDIGKMDEHDDLYHGAPITRMAIEAILSENDLS